MYWYEGSIWQYGWVFPLIMIAFCLVIMRGRCCLKGGWRESSAPADDLPRDPNFPPRKEMTKMDAFNQMMGRMADR